MMAHPLLGNYTRKLIYDEIIPSIDLDTEMLNEFAGGAERFKTPFIKHYLLDILLNSVSKYATGFFFPGGLFQEKRQPGDTLLFHGRSNCPLPGPSKAMP